MTIYYQHTTIMQEKPIIHFITYGDDKYKNSKDRLTTEASDFGEFKTIKAYGPEFFSPAAMEPYKHIFSQPRGGGYWIWRPFIILDKLKDMNDGEFLIYLDAGCELNPKGKKRFYEYIDLLQNSKYGIMSFVTPFRELNFTTSRIFQYLNIPVDSHFGMSGQACGGILVMKKNEHLMKIINLMIKSLEDDALMWSDHYNTTGNHFGFIDNRHDQSISSLLRKIHGSVMIRDESDCDKFRDSAEICYPFRASRISG